MNIHGDLKWRNGDWTGTMKTLAPKKEQTEIDDT
jgi:hypothetical protein